MQHLLAFSSCNKGAIKHIQLTQLILFWQPCQSELLAHKKNNAVDFSIIKKWIAPTLIGSAIGAIIAGLISGFYLTLFFATIALLVCIHLLTYNDNLRLGKQLPSGFF